MEDRSGVHIGVDPVQLTHRQILSSGEHRVNSAKPERFDNDPGALASASAENANCNRRAAMEFSKKQMDIGLVTADAEKARRFYGEVMGLAEHTSLPMRDDMTRYGFSAGSSTLKFWSRPEPLANFAGALNASVGIRFVTLWVRKIDALAAALEARGAKIVIPPMQLPDARIFFAEDPDGNWIEFAEPAQ